MNREFAVDLQQRRTQVLSRLNQGILVLFSAPIHIRNGDVEQAYRQDSDFYYLTGFTEPESALLLSERTGLVLFVRERNREKETWEGRRVGVEGAVEKFGAQTAHPFAELAVRMADYFEDQPSIHYLIGQNRDWDHQVLDAMNAVRSRRRKRVTVPSQLVDARLCLHELRLKKSKFEQQKMAEVAELSSAAHCNAMRACTAGMLEWELQNVVETEFRRQGAERLAYDSIVGSGENGTILHYRENNCAMSDGQLVLIDAGAEKSHYAADITRTFPVNGKFTELQARLYQAVIDAQSSAIARCVVGATLDEIHEAAWQVLRVALQAEGLVSPEDQADDERLKNRVNCFYMHRTSHYLGMDVHDVGAYYDGKLPRALEPGVVLTVEPGLYFAADDETVPVEYRGIGIRIEDDVLVTEDGPQVLTSHVPKQIAEVERMCQTAI